MQYELRWDVTQCADLELDHNGRRSSQSVFCQLMKDYGQNGGYNNTSFKTHKLYPMVSLGWHFDVTKIFAIQLEGQVLMSLGYKTPKVDLKRQGVVDPERQFISEFQYGVHMKYRALLNFVFFVK